MPRCPGLRSGRLGSIMAVAQFRSSSQHPNTQESEGVEDCLPLEPIPMNTEGLRFSFCSIGNGTVELTVMRAFHSRRGSLGRAEQEPRRFARRTHVSVHATYLPSIHSPRRSNQSGTKMPGSPGSRVRDPSKAGARWAGVATSHRLVGWSMRHPGSRY
jgi:hypothetical protein